MGIFDFLFGKTITIDNSFFGKMLFFEFKKKPENNYFECKRNFKPIKKEIEICLYGDISSSTENQELFFYEIENNYSKIKTSIIPIIENEFRNWKDEFKIIDFEKEFTPVHLTIPRSESKEKIWEIAFESKHDLNHLFSITMKNFIATEIMIDG